MPLKVYAKKGNKSYKEARLIAKITEALEKKIAEDPSIIDTFVPANNMEELQRMHDKYYNDGVAEAEYEDLSETTNTKNSNMSQDKPKSASKDYDYDDDDSSIVDPFNREEPIVRSYVTETEFPDENKEIANSQTSFDEPLTSDDSFLMPDDELPTNKMSTQNSGGAGKDKQKDNKPKIQPLNPDFDDMSNGKKRRSVKKFAKYIVEATSSLTSKGFVWYATKDINDSKLAQYEINDEMDLDTQVTLEDGQVASVRQFFKLQCYKAEQLSEITKEEKEDLTEATAEVMMEKGVAPTPMQELMLTAGTILGRQAITLISMSAQTNSLLNQLRQMKQEDGGSSYKRPTPPPPQYQEEYREPEPKPQPETPKEPYAEIVQEPQQTMVENDWDSLDDIIVETPIETKE